MKRVGISGGENIFSSPGVYAWGSGDRNNLSLLQESVGKIPSGCDVYRKGSRLPTREPIYGREVFGFAPIRSFQISIRSGVL